MLTPSNIRQIAPLCSTTDIELHFTEIWMKTESKELDYGKCLCHYFSLFSQLVSPLPWATTKQHSPLCHYDEYKFKYFTKIGKKKIPHSWTMICVFVSKQYKVTSAADNEKEKHPHDQFFTLW